MAMEGGEIYYYTEPIDTVRQREPLSENPMYDGLYYEQVDAAPAIPSAPTTDIQDNPEQSISRQICYSETITQNKLLPLLLVILLTSFGVNVIGVAYSDAKLVAAQSSACISNSACDEQNKINVSNLLITSNVSGSSKCEKQYRLNFNYRLTMCKTNGGEALFDIRKFLNNKSTIIGSQFDKTALLNLGAIISDIDDTLL